MTTIERINLSVRPFHVSHHTITELCEAMHAAGRSELVHYAGASYRDEVAWRMCLAWQATPLESEAALKARVLGIPVTRGTNTKDAALERVVMEHAPSVCQCGRWSGVPCSSTGAYALVEYMPLPWRAQHAAAGNRGMYPHNGAQRLQVTSTCAERMIDEDAYWCSIVEAVR